MLHILMLFDKIICSEILKKNPSKLLHNFCRHVLSMKSSENLVEQVYSVLLSRPAEDEDNVITLTLHNSTEVTIGSQPFLQCLRNCGIPLNNIKELKAKCWTVTEEDWEALYIQTGSGTILDIKQIGNKLGGAAYSPRILEMLQSHTLRNFR